MSDGRAREVRERGVRERKDWTRTSLGERVEHVCAIRGWSLNRLGEEAGLASGVISRLARREANTAGAPDTLARVADAAGVNVVWLMLGRGPVEGAEPGPASLRDHPDWPQALAEAKRWQRGIPEEFWVRAGDVSLLAPPRLDWQLVVGIVRELYSAHQRALEAAERTGEAASPGAAPPARPRARAARK
jgi:transcriptional regulator with XRE-family HTH domain